ncbi:translation initiation factor IF-2 [Pseudanabaena sp. PCC 6802]|uniref:translation initiation factor IF-2 n=1 Tax=Pseudanabaena sp. PCC 6802 TaxID=118173 RepID=UPI000349E244|nr:translation initiation factor IF-2 [Pseudanabaena sp. PCC 6802]
MSIGGKVRVYELTRELNLETKDILAICEQLNIAVKSHSSTITESEANLIRAAAPERRSVASTPAPKHREAARETAKEPVDKDLRPAKQQIVTVSKPAANLAAPPVAMPVRPHKPSAPIELQVTAEEQPEFVSVPADKTTDLEDAATLQIAQPPARHAGAANVSSPEDVKAGVELVSETAAGASENTDVVVEDVVAKVDAPPKTPLVQKPAPAREAALPPEPLKPIASSDSKRAPKSPQASASASKPMLTKAPTRQHKPQEILAEAASTRSEVKSEANSEARFEEKSSDKPPAKGVAKPISERPKPVVRSHGAPPKDIQTPRRPQVNRPTPVKDAVLIERGITAPNDPPRQLRAPIAPQRPERPERPEKSDRPERPTLVSPVRGDKPGIGAPALAIGEPGSDRGLSRPGKRNKSKKDDDDQEMLELREKAARLNKPKRYLQAIEDDDIIEELEEDVPQISLSLARPTARPKQRMAKPAAATSIAKPGADKSTRKSRDRRSLQEVVVEKPTKLILQSSITVQELANQLMLPETDIIRTLFIKGVMVNINQTLDIPTASMVAIELGFEVEESEADAPARKVTEMIEVQDLESLQKRPPVVTIMGHVDHGKTTLLDSIRKSKVAQGEAGGITQHIGAYHVDVEHNGTKEQIVFLDTPGHEAFTAMRARGARVTDVAVLVVAADDGVQPQTIEAISHARAAKVPIIVAINKVDKLEAQPDRIRQELTEHGLVDEEWGGETIMVPVSAIKGENLDTLLEMILLVAEVEDLRANPNRTARGTVIEANLDKARGPVATLLVQNGTLRIGDVLLAGASFGKVRAMIDDQGKRVEEASPSFAVEVLGLSDVPAAGDEFEVFTDEKLARATASDRASQQRQSRLQQSMASRRVTLGTVSAQAQEGELKELNLILKADVQGSVEAILNALEQLPQQEVQLRVLLAGAGEITENDVDLAAASSAVIIGFNTTMATGARQAADELGVDVRDYNIIYKLLEDIQGAMEGLLEPELVEEHLGIAEVRAIFPIGKGVVAGCYVQSGKLIRNCKVRVNRNGNPIHEAPLDSLKRMKDDVKEVAAGFECGVSLPKFNDWQEGDRIEAFRLVTKRRTLST